MSESGNGVARADVERRDRVTDLNVPGSTGQLVIAQAAGGRVAQTAAAPRPNSAPRD